MEKVHRYLKSTIAKQIWEFCVIESDNKIELIKTHYKSNRVDVIKETTKEISKQDLEKFKLKNSEFHIETYERNPTN